MMTMAMISLKQATECITCGSSWTTETELEKFCGKCNSYIIDIDGEVYTTQGW